MLQGISNLLKGKKGLITGIANNMSIAYGIAKMVKASGAELALTYQGEVLEKRIFSIAGELETDFVLQCDVTDENSIKSLAAALQEKWGKLDFVVHAIAFADKNELRGRYIDTSLNNFLNSLNVSCYSLTALARELEPIMNPGGSIISLTYLGAEKVIPYYNTMGISKAALEASIKYLAADMGENNIRVNGLSAGPIKTLASSGIGDFKSMLNIHAATAPLKRNTTHADVAGAALYLLSDLSSGVTGEIHYVDCGYNIMGMSQVKGE